MTLEETRNLGIEFERRVQTMMPDTEIAEKLDTETIYSYLNQYQDKYIHDIYRNLDNIQSGTKLSAHIESVLLSMLKSETISVDDAKNYTESEIILDPNEFEIIDTARSVVYPLDPAFYMYVRSASNVSSTYSFRGNQDAKMSRTRVLPNELVSQSDAWKLIETPHNSLRILRHPAAILTEDLEFNGEKRPTLTVLYDQYTTPLGIKVVYYKQPGHFDIMTSTACELPSDAFDDIVTGAVDLYVSYVAGAEARKRQMQEQQAKRAREDQRDARRSGGNQDEQS